MYLTEPVYTPASESLWPRVLVVGSARALQISMLELLVRVR